jgi:hypothetical protein
VFFWTFILKITVLGRCLPLIYENLTLSQNDSVVLNANMTGLNARAVATQVSSRSFYSEILNCTDFCRCRSRVETHGNRSWSGSWCWISLDHFDAFHRFHYCLGNHNYHLYFLFRHHSRIELFHLQAEVSLFFWISENVQELRIDRQEYDATPEANRLDTDHRNMIALQVSIFFCFFTPKY